MPAQHPIDWAGDIRRYGLAWGLPIGVMVGGLLIDVPARMILWILALVWMGAACVLNARRCGRTHCRFTGPYYLVMIIPVLALGSGIASFGKYGWLTLGVLIIAGSKLIWMWGRFS
jgi:hypothetical protein